MKRIGLLKFALNYRNNFTKIYYLLKLFEKTPSLVQQCLYNIANQEYNIDLRNFSAVLPSSTIAGNYNQFTYNFRSAVRMRFQVHRSYNIFFFKCEFCNEYDHIFSTSVEIQSYEDRFQLLPCCEQVFIHKSCIPAAFKRPAWQCGYCNTFILYGRVSNLTFGNSEVIWIDGIPDHKFNLL